MTASLVMDANPTVLNESDSISTAVDYIMRNRYRNVPVVDDAGRYLGVFGVGCILRLMLPKAIFVQGGESMAGFIRESPSDLHRRFSEIENRPITHCITDEPEVVAPDTPLVETLLTLYKTRSSVPVVEPESGRLVGMISYFDAAATILEAEI